MNHLFIIGAQRSGSTFLYTLLDGHPEIAMAQPVRPEPKYFLDDVVAAGREAYERAWFADLPEGTRVCGEKSTSYIERPDAGERIRALYPDARILAILRDPVRRAYSNYCFSVDNGIETLTFAEALAAESERARTTDTGTSVNPYAYRERGDFATYLAPYYELFGRDNVRVEILEELRGAPAAIANLYEWLGVDPAFQPVDSARKVNASTSSAPLDAASRASLIDFYSARLGALEALIDRNLDVWRHAWS